MATPAQAKAPSHDLADSPHTGTRDLVVTLIEVNAEEKTSSQSKSLYVFCNSIKILVKDIFLCVMGDRDAFGNFFTNIFIISKDTGK